ncbi:hypothetical protein [Dinghuibacter silviterrae]|uniref:Uncharacterized protein n=1 Tax=Dinghuibacter silviterrae TaxID=1539049 RepID=A0A4R8DH71_9BACT|nr:hypothetical protein [Dinghuibacter silviterrae]TDW96847.1 hypothetical protein EDB95_4683 [Dinghuibacter silviterrae]
MTKKDIQIDEDTVKIMAGILLDRILMDPEDQFEARVPEQRVKAHIEAGKLYTELSDTQRILNKIRNYRRCSLRTRKAFQELMHRVSPPLLPLTETQTHSDSLT